MANKITTTTAQNTLKHISKEAISLESTSIISLYEIDLSSIKSALNLHSTALPHDVLRFHNEESFNQKNILFRGETYYPMPIIADGFEVNSNGSLPRPTLTLTSLKGVLEESVSSNYFLSLKRAILELENMIGAKVSRIRTFYKFLDSSNNLEGVGDFTSGFNNNPEFPKESYFVERKISEDKDGIQFELSSVLDIQNFKVPGRVCLANRCPFTYRGEGCCYEFKDLGSVSEHGATAHLPDFAPPIANDENKNLTGIITGSDGSSSYDPTAVTSSSVIDYVSDLQSRPNNTFTAGQVVYLSKDEVNYYYVAKKSVPSGNPPPNSEYWEADRCSKSMDGCKLRWGSAGAGKKFTNPPATDKGPANTYLPFGGFPGTNTRTSVQ